MMQYLIAAFRRRRLLRNPPAPLRVAVLLVAVLLYGTTGFLYFELPENPDLTWADGIWYSIVTVTTAGYGDYYPVTAGGRFVVAMPLMFFGIGLLGYVLSLAAAVLIEAKTKELRGMADFNLKDHLIIFNYPSAEKVGRVLDELANDPAFPRGTDVVLIDADLTELPVALEKRDVHFVRGSPTLDETLERACIDTARHAVVLTRRANDPASDDHNVTITLAVEARNPKVNTVVECVASKTEELLKKAGCDSIVCTANFDALFLTSELLNPGIQQVLAQLTSSMVGQQLYLTPYSGSKATRFSRIAKQCREARHLAIGIRSEGQTNLNVSDDDRVRKGDSVITIGPDPLSQLG